MQHPENYKHYHAWNSIVHQMTQLSITQMTCNEVLGKYSTQKIKCALESLEATGGGVEPDLYLVAMLEQREYVPPRSEPALLPEKRPPTVLGKRVPGSVETMAALNKVCLKSDRQTGLNALKAIKERLNAKG